MTVNEEIFRETIGVEDLWCPVEECSHEKWVTSLVCTILKTFAQENCFISELIPVCSAKVSIAKTHKSVCIISVIFLLLYTSGRVELWHCGTAVPSGLVVPHSYDWWMNMEEQQNNWQKYSEKHPVPPSPPQIPHRLPRDGTWHSVVRSQWPTAWTVTWNGIRLQSLLCGPFLVKIFLIYHVYN